MKRVLLGAGIIFLSSCNNDTNSVNDPTAAEAPTTQVAGKRVCPSDAMREEILLKDPSARARVEAIEQYTEKRLSDIKVGKVLADGTVEIPVVFNVVYNTSSENVSDARLQSQIDVLNRDFGATNSDINNTPAEFVPVKAGDTKIRFRLAKTVRKQSSTTIWNPDENKMKSATTGIAATSPDNYLNIWIVNNMTDGTLGYAYYPGTITASLDGVVIGAPYIGTGSGTAAPYNLGRTTTHEVGHYLNLPHLWGSSNTGCQTDYSNDTPASPGPNFGVPTYPLNRVCGGVSRSQIFMNYMDYVDDKVMHMFTANQKQRMQAVVSASGPRSGLRLY
ncbi:zinc metalloprotease [Chryseobacterium indologenes]|uniref:Zinc metalloprotease n=1 Tax=Chryseobacterium indologenes TaxID=253 RepID=A0A1Z3W7S2_CHRID|nr:MULTISPECIES: zinc metalloprotease [Chryseobacterium]ASE63806.1 zinc metalloprotease [Chryseobacterium indologenes]ATN07800.1 zinc metalloprotease [Chryseobacterium indologenes]AYY83463.1 zinc metalloprotease [Chryseobacterium indologenes]AZB19514.1 zinc metalloprotease [Chryseobacterium indologenes]QIX80374.1 zinc metalloprotease [Chryseobacterium indologenes]